MEALYTATATVVGGRSGSVESSDGTLKHDLRMPKELGGPGGQGTNPEQLFAAGYGACFESALTNVARKEGIKADNAVVTSHVNIGKDPADGGFQLSVQLDIKVPGVEERVLQDLIQKAHNFCPYSKAIRGNIEVKLNAVM
ncbi:Ohr subfamily peroxiredoxin [Paenibacillus shirakamiensis]|uniref:Ohr subfamily peroxiredoxin n=1 Tax=Paenibacillus shirakamiensis TaxID=1265935 RepID=A0ABS4JIX3_9BACL|nr:organic hydroperoxide resistance protein [Paenibacillus shirakamiensis]MBP2000564.1 Ohr subfamily peroxiredoxin [Paenibacillus shirakamiensis]